MYNLQVNLDKCAQTPYMYVSSIAGNFSPCASFRCAGDAPKVHHRIRNGALGRAAAQETLRNGAYALRSCFLNARD